MTDEQKSSDLTMHLVVTLDGDPTIVGQPHTNEGDARKTAEEASLKNPGHRYGVYTKTGTVVSELKAEWKGRAA